MLGGPEHCRPDTAVPDWTFFTCCVLYCTLLLCRAVQSVVDQTQQYPDWTFFYTRLRRQTDGDESSFEYMKEAGLEVEIGSSFANLMIASECDYFVGVLGSNWNRLINELRLTNGRLRTKYFALNFDEW